MKGKGWACCGFCLRFFTGQFRGQSQVKVDTVGMKDPLYRKNINSKRKEKKKNCKGESKGHVRV